MKLEATTESRINQESLDLIRSKMLNSPELGLGAGEVEMAIGEYRRFLILKMENPDVSMAPTGLMDKAWHAHILDTRRYARDCEAMFGRFLHHRPSYAFDGSNDGDESLARASRAMSSLYSRRFGHDPLDMGAGCNTDDDGSACTGVSCCDG
tara:strand:+ start:802 stop:1257 length:456 start_codon:yes stop_codon:yes gene_type:complete